MDVHRSFQNCEWCLGVHEIKNGVDHFVATYSQEGCSQDKLGFFVNDNFHKALSLAFFEGAANFFHGHFCNKRGPP